MHRLRSCMIIYKSNYHNFSYLVSINKLKMLDLAIFLLSKDCDIGKYKTVR